MPKYVDNVYSDDISIDMFWNLVGVRMCVLEKLHKLSVINSQYIEVEYIYIKKSILRSLRKNTRKKEYKLLNLINILIKNISPICL